MRALPAVLLVGLLSAQAALAGRYWDNTVIEVCLINSSCNGIRLIGPGTRLTIANSLFSGPGEGGTNGFG